MLSKYHVSIWEIPFDKIESQKNHWNLSVKIFPQILAIKFIAILTRFFFSKINGLLVGRNKNPLLRICYFISSLLGICMYNSHCFWFCSFWRSCCIVVFSHHEPPSSEQLIMDGVFQRIWTDFLYNAGRKRGLFCF